MALSTFLKKPITLVVILLSAVVVLVVSSGYGTDPENTTFHDMEDILLYRAMTDDLPDQSNSLFTASGKCNGCHGYDPNEYASLTVGGWDVNVTDHWRSTMMANSARDPFWKAKVSHEVAVNPSHQLELEDKCTSCHAPMGKYGALHAGIDHYTMAMLAADTVGQDGVSCNACHQQSPVGIGSSFSGELSFVEDTLYGQYGASKDEDPLFAAPMISFVGFEPVYGEHVVKSELCAGCHTLITNTVDLDGVSTGGTFVEQATYHEWLNSAYADELNPNHQECQGCHVPSINEDVVISANYAFLQPRNPFGLHYFVGANTFMLEMLRDYGDTLGVTATTAQFDSTITRTLDMLQNQSLEVDLEEVGLTQDTAMYKVTLRNLAGHKFPSGYPSRRAYIEFKVADPDGNTLFASGLMDDMYELTGQDPEFEPHYQVIRNEDEVQIYEQVMGDVNDNVTTVLERADHLLKDNRLAPLGFSTSHAAYDTTLIAGNALVDPDFNRENDVEGSGTDEVYFHIPLNGYYGEVIVSAQVYYQSVPPKWNEEMFSVSTPEIEHFEEMYWEVGADPVYIGGQMLETTTVGVGEVQPVNLAVYPNPNTDGWLKIQSDQKVELVQVYRVNGQLVRQEQLNALSGQIQLPNLPGTYIVVLQTSTSREVRRVIRL